ncbi:MAG: DsrE/DsrF/DrsH-like family protein [Bacilli bacterium]|jgi:NADPH-dependent 2,4-dienoyl-CoA reductase/sulfur reductase-like enzyme/peroxiredoxin family protein/rhodanese-related sulfurtransferase/TusA-related sulfurtransferase|nr:DsrE/DsrF/DrsH-like family protein [Bacilli bacterium]
MSKILIIGGVAGGATAATRLRRLSEDDEIIVIERGGFVSFANCGLPYYLGGVIKDRERLLQETPESLKAKYNLDVRIHQEAVSVDPVKKSVHLRDLAGNKEYDETFDKLILSTGTTPRKISFAGLDEADNVYYLRNMEDADSIFAALSKSPKTALVVGGGFIGVETAENLKERGLAVTLVEGRDQILPPFDPELAVFLSNELSQNGIRVKLGLTLKGFEDKGHKVILANGESVAADIVILSLGVAPENALAKSAGLELTKDGYVLTDEKMETIDAVTHKPNPDILAVGDAVAVKDPLDGTLTHIALAGPANRQARLAADTIHGLPYTYKGAIGTSVLKVFSLTGASTGYSEALCERKGLAHQSVMIERNQHAGYYPGASLVTLKVVFDPASGKIYGAQAVGLEGVEKRIDVLATAIRGGLTVMDLTDLELSYAPPYGMAKDIVNIAGYVASNLKEGQFRQIPLSQLDTEKKDAILIDARTPLEYSLEHFEGAVNIPFSTLRQNLDKLPKDKAAKIIVYCNVGLTAYQWIRVAVNLGYTNLYNVEGGMRLYKTIHQTPKAPEAKAETAAVPAKEASKMIEIDATGLQCPGPIMEASKASEKLAPGERMRITASDCGFTSDIGLWAKTTGNSVISNETKDGKIVAVIEKGPGVVQNTNPTGNGGTTIVLFSGDMDKALAAMIIAQGTRAMGKPATVFCTFWGLNLLRKPKAPHVKKSFVEKMFGWMMPKGAKKFKLSKMNMMGMGSKMMRGVMKKKNVPVLEEQLANAKRAGVQFLACTMSMDIMGIKKEELIDGIDYVGVATYLAACQEASTTLFI